MISHLTRDYVNIEKYDNCISKAMNSEIYAYSWYLDIVTDKQWDVLVLGDYEVVMPLPWRKKYSIKYIYPPFWILQLGIFYQINEFSESEFIATLKRKFRFIELKMNTKNFLEFELEDFESKEYHLLDLNTDYNSLKTSFRSDRLKDLKKAVKNSLKEVWNDKPQKLVDLFKENVGTRIPNLVAKDYQRLERLMNHCIDANMGEVVSVYDENGTLSGSAFILKHQKSITILCSSTDFQNRDNGANTFLIDRIIHKYYKAYESFYFGGSSIKSIARYFNSFGALPEKYYLFKYNNLPWPFRFLKR